MKRVFVLLLAFAAWGVCAQDFDSAKLDKYFALLEKEDKAMLSVAIVDGGEPVYQRSIGFADVASGRKAGADTQYRVGSITKVFTAVMIFQLIEEEKLSLDTPLSTFFPDIKNAGAITIGMLLSHRSGLHNFTNLPAYRTYMTSPRSKAEMLSVFEALEAYFPPGTDTRYSNTGYVLLGYIIEELGNDSYASQLQSRIVKKAGLKRTAYGDAIDVEQGQANSYYYDGGWQPATETNMSVPHGAGAVISTPTDVATFLTALFEGKLVSSSSLAMMKRVQKGLGHGLFPFPFYERTLWGHNGSIDGFASQSGYFEMGNVAFALTANGVNYTLNEISVAVLSIYFGLPYELPDFSKEPVTLSESQLSTYEGTYSSDAIPLKITLTVKDGILMAQATGQNAFPLTAFSPTEFQFEPAGIVMMFKSSGKENEKPAFDLLQGGGNYLFVRE